MLIDFAKAHDMDKGFSDADFEMKVKPIPARIAVEEGLIPDLDDPSIVGKETGEGKIFRTMRVLTNEARNRIDDEFELYMEGTYYNISDIVKSYLRFLKDPDEYYEVGL